MLTLIILICLFVGFYGGYRRGLLQQLIVTFSYVVTFWFARIYYQPLAKKLELLVPYPAPSLNSRLLLFDDTLLFDMDQAFYAAIAFLLILLIGWLITKLISVLSYRLMFVPLLKTGNALAGGVLNLVVVMLGLSLLLTMLAMLPLEFVQSMFEGSLLARFLVEHTPILSHLLREWWIVKMIG